MTYRSILVLLDQHQSCGARTQSAIRLAGDLNCHLVGLAPTGVVNVPAPFETTAGLAEFAATVQRVLRDEAEQVARLFRVDCCEAQLKSYEAVVHESDKALSLVHHAHCSDLVVLTQADLDARDHRSAQALVEQVVLSNARPTLLLPYAGRLNAVGTHAMVAWDDSREAARALSDALPLLRLAKRVQVVSWNEGLGYDDETLRPRLDALHQWLVWQGIDAEMRVETTDGHVAEAMLSHAADIGADLIVMGAYGHSRWMERLLGGATRGMLASMTVPVLMSH